MSVHSRTLSAASALSALAVFGTSAWAGPPVGSTLGVPSTATTTVNAKVVSSTPVVAQVAVPRQACYDELRPEPARGSGAGAVIGAIAGAALGNAVGKGSGRAVATGVGLIGGAVLGNHIETDGRTYGTRTERRCEQHTTYENQVVAYSVVYEVGGQRYSTQLPQEPGATIPVQLSVTPAVSTQVVHSPAQVVVPAPVVMPAPVHVSPAPYQTVVYTTHPRWVGGHDRHKPVRHVHHHRRHHDDRRWH